MTSVDYIDREGNVLNEKSFWQYEETVSNNKKETIGEIVKDRIDNFKPYEKAKELNEQKLKDKVEAKGGKVIRVMSQPINKRRYKRNVAKLLAKEKATY